MEQIAEQIVQQRINEIIPEIQQAAYSKAYNDIVNALSFDVTSAVNIAFENGESIFRDSKTQKVVADAVMREIRRMLSDSILKYGTLRNALTRILPYPTIPQTVSRDSRADSRLP